MRKDSPNHSPQLVKKLKPADFQRVLIYLCGEGGIRTRGTVSSTTV